MKVTSSIIVMFLFVTIFGISLPRNVLAQTYDADAMSEPESRLTPAPFSEQDVPTPVTMGDITYLSGGIGDSESAAMSAIAKKYPLEIVFVQRQNQREEYLAAVKLQIKDHHQNVVLDIVTEGPYFLADLPIGKYLLVAEYNGNAKQQWVSVIAKKHQKIVFWWSFEDTN
ncbi:MAG: hypothetical protein WCG35_10030 [Betaproteobacteria bacterium]